MKLLLCVATLVSIAAAAKKLDTVYQWKYIDYLFNSKEHREDSIKNGDYNHTQIMAIDVDRAKGLKKNDMKFKKHRKILIIFFFFRWKNFCHHHSSRRRTGKFVDGFRYLGSIWPVTAALSRLVLAQ